MDYARYQRFFNGCLREWYLQYSEGANYYYVERPGLLFTRLRSVKESQGHSIVDDMFQWYFQPNISGGRKENLNFIGLKRNVYRQDGNVTRTDDGKTIKSTLHIAHDNWYSNFIAQKLNHKHNIAYCNSYDVAFNTLYNYGRFNGLDMDDLRVFPRFRILTGNLLSIPSLLNLEVFESIILHINNRNIRNLLSGPIMITLHEILAKCGYIIVVTKEPELVPKIKQHFINSKNKTLWINRSLLLNNIEDPNVNTFIHDLEEYFKELKSEFNHILIGNAPIKILCYYKLQDHRPNSMLRKAVTSLA